MIQGCSQHRRFTRYLGKMLVNHHVCWLLVETYFLLLEPLFVNFNLFFSRTEFLANINAVPPGWDMAQNGKWVYSWNYPLDLLNSVRSQGLPASIGYIYIYVLVGGWPTPSEKNDFVSWDDAIPNIWKVIKFMFQSTNQHIYIYICSLLSRVKSTHGGLIQWNLLGSFQVTGWNFLRKNLRPQTNSTMEK
jgi:hypothetical protein